MRNLKNLSCPLCLNPKLKKIQHPQFDLFQCDCCYLVFKDSKHHLAYEAEAARYSTHQNSFEDIGYVNFLKQLAVPMSKYLNPTMKGIDFGCGPGPTLSKIFAQSGLVQDNYDPLFFPLELKQDYDFLTSTEVIEHFHDPRKGFKEIQALVKVDGIIGLMTSFYDDEAKLENWYYVADPTHVCFFHHQTLLWLAQEFQWELLDTSERIAIFRVSK